MELRFGLEFEANYDPDDERIINIADVVGMDVGSDGSVRVGVGEDDEPEWIVCECGNPDCTEGRLSEDGRSWLCYGGEWTEPECYGVDGGAELRTPGTWSWAELVAAYQNLWDNLGPQDHTAGVHLHISVACECGHCGPPILAPTMTVGDGRDLRNAAAAMIDDDTLFNREYVMAGYWDGLGGYGGAFRDRTHHQTCEIRWLHSTLNPQRFVEAVQLMLSHMVCPTCALPAGGVDIFAHGEALDGYLAAYEAWARRVSDIEETTGLGFTPETYTTHRAEIRRHAKAWKAIADKVLNKVPAAA